MNKLILGIYLYRILSRAYFYLPFLLIYFLAHVNSGLKMLFYGGLKMSFFSGLRLSYI
ncbi:major facilitator superfamily protein [Staphylococcus aureus]|nr:major facilitator superfamily protein [Staphylococcus aureus]